MWKPHILSRRSILRLPSRAELLAIDFFDAGFWDRVHGGSTHLPIALALTSALLDSVGSIVRHRTSRIGFSIYLIAILTTAVLISIAGFWGGEMVLNR
jgi:hypothetical protein